MKILSWNIRGLNNPWKIKILSKKIKKTNSVIVFLQETKCQVAQIQNLSKKIWKKSEGMGLYARGYAGGLGILWDSKGLGIPYL